MVRKIWNLLVAHWLIIAAIAATVLVAETTEAKDLDSMLYNCIADERSN